MTRRSERLYFGLILASVAILLAGCADPRIQVDEHDLLGSWEYSASEGGTVQVELEADGSFRMEGMPKGAFCAGMDHRIRSSDWREPETVDGNWELDDAQGPGSLPLHFLGTDGCVSNAYVVQRSGAPVIRMLIGPSSEGATIFAFIRIDGP